MNKKNLKKFIAIICAIAILPWGYFSQMGILQAEASGAVTASSDLERWDIADVGLNTGDYAGSTEGIATGATLDKKAFVTKMTFPYRNSTWRNNFLYIGGIYLDVCDNGASADKVYLKIDDPNGKYGQSHTIDVSKFNLETIVGTKIELMVTTEFVNTNEATTDVNIGLYVNGVLYNDDYLVMKNIPLERLMQNVTVYGANGTISLEKPITKPSDLEVWDVDTVKLKSKAISAMDGTTGLATSTGRTQNKTAFRTKITYPAGLPTGGKYAELWLGKARLQGPCLRSYTDVTGENNLQFLLRNASGAYPLNIIVTPADFNMTTSLVGRELEVIITTELVQAKDGKTTAYYGLYIDGNLYQNKYIIVNDITPSHLEQCVYGEINWTGAHLLVDVFPTTPEELKSWTIDTVALRSGDYTGNVSGVATGKMQNKTAFSADVILPEGIDASHEALLFIGEFGKGYAVQVKNDTVNFQHWAPGKVQTIATLTAATAGVEGLTNLLGQKFNMTITTEFVNVNKDAGTGELYVGLYINGVLYGGNYFRLKDVPLNSLMQQIYVYNQYADGKNTFLGIPVTPLSQFEKWTITDVQLAEGEYSVQGGTAIGETQDKKALYTAIRFPEVIDSGRNSEFWVGEQNNGLRFLVEGGNLILSHYCSEGEKSLGVISPTVAGDYATLLGEKIDLIVATEFVNNNGTRTDANIGIYINGVLYNAQCFTVKDVPVSSLQQQVYVNNEWANGKTTWLSASMRADQPPITPWEELDRWTISDVGLSEGEFAGNVTGTANGKTQDGMAFATAVKFPEGIDSAHESSLFIGELSNGFSFKVQGGKIYFYHNAPGKAQLLATLSAEEAQCSALLGKELDLVLTVEFDNNDGTTTDANVGLYIDGNLYGDKAFKLQGVPVSSLKQQIYVYNQWAGGKTTWMSPVLKSEAPTITSPDSLDKWTIETVGMAEGEYHIHTSKATGASLDGKALYTAVKFPVISDSAHNSELWIGEYVNGFQFEAKNNQLYFKHVSSATGEKIIATLSPNQVGLDTFLGKKLDMIVTTEFVNNDGTNTDVYVGLYFNGIFYGSRYFKIENVPVSSLKQQIYVSNQWAGGQRTWLWVDSQSDMEDIFAADFGLENKVVENDKFVSNAGTESLKATAINMELNFPDKKGNSIYFGGEECGVVLSSNGDGTLALAYKNSGQDTEKIATLKPKNVNLKSLTNQDIGMRLAFKIYESSKTMELGVFVNGQLYNGAYFTVENVEIETLQRVIGIDAQNAKITISNPKYEELTFNDFSILDAKFDTEKVSPSYQRYNYYDLDLLGKTAIEGTLKFANKADGTYVNIGGEQWYGIRLYSQKDGKLMLDYAPKKGVAKYFAIDPAIVGMSSLTGTDLKVRITFDLIKVSNNRTDLQLGLYINGALYNGEFFKITNVDTTVLTRTCYVCVTAGPTKVESVKKPIDLSIYGVGTDWRKQLGLK